MVTLGSGGISAAPCSLPLLRFIYFWVSGSWPLMSLYSAKGRTWAWLPGYPKHWEMGEGHPSPTPCEPRDFWPLYFSLGAIRLSGVGLSGYYKETPGKWRWRVRAGFEELALHVAYPGSIRTSTYAPPQPWAPLGGWRGEGHPCHNPTGP